MLIFGSSPATLALSSAFTIGTKGDLCEYSHSDSVSDAHTALWS